MDGRRQWGRPGRTVVILVLPSLLTCIGPMSVYDRRSYVFVISEINASVYKYFELLLVSLTFRCDYISSSRINSLWTIYPVE